MTRYADSSVCPDCASHLVDSPSSCPRCHLPLHHPLTAELFATLSRADHLLGQLRRAAAPVPVPVPAAPAGSFVPPMPPMPAPAPRPDRTGLRPTSVPAILLSLGATCLLVAAVIFLAVAWSWLGVGGRTAVLAGLTVTGAGLGGWLTARGLRVAGEALSTVTFGLLTLDLIGADRAGWLGQRTSAELGVLVGLSLLGVALSWSITQPRLAAPQLVAGLGLFTAYAAIVSDTAHPLVVSAVAVIAFAALGAVGRANRLPLLPWVALAGAAPCWISLTLPALAESALDPTLSAMWSAGRPGWALLAATALLLLPVATREEGVTLVCLAAAASLAVATICLPVIDEGTSELTLTALVVVAAGVAAVIRTERGWLLVPLLPAVLAALPVLAVWLTMVAAGVERLLDSGDPFSAPVGVRLAPFDPIAHPALVVPSALALLALAWVALRPKGITAVLVPGAAVVALSIGATIAHYPVPLWSVVAALLVLAAAAAPRDLVFGSGLVAAALVVGLPSGGLTVVTTAALVVACIAALSLARWPAARAGAALVLPAAAAGLLWSVFHVTGVDVAQRGVPVTLAVGLLAIVLHRWEVEVSAAATAYTACTLAVAAAADQPGSLALHLTVAGALASAHALLHRDRRTVAWLGGLLLAAATWVRLADIGVDTPEAYTLPTALALLLVGLDRLRRDPAIATGPALTPGLLLATVPSLLWALAEPVSMRAVLLGAGCLLLVLGGSRLRWNAPFVVGAVVGGLLVLRELAPYAAETPQWVMIGLAGTLLTVVGVTWERRLVELRQAAAYLDRLR